MVSDHGKEEGRSIPAGNWFEFFLCVFSCCVLLLKHLRIKIPFREKSKGIQWLFLTTEIRHHYDPFKALPNF